MMTNDVLIWWQLLCTVAAVNVVVWAGSAAALQRGRTNWPTEALAFRRWQLLLSAGYVFGCAFRSVLPVFDVPRICIFDTWLSSVVVGRSVATVAELCFVAQWALMLSRVSAVLDSRPGRRAALAIVPLICVAELCSWYSVLTTSNLGHVLEETLWGLCAALLVASMLHVWPNCSRRHRPLLLAWCVAGVGYVLFMFMVDVPMYWTRWLADEAAGRTYMTLAQGMTDVSGRWVVSHRWDDWQHEVTWMSLYFSVAVWISIGLIHAPVPERLTRTA